LLITISRWFVLAASLSMFFVYFGGGALVIQDTRKSVKTTGDTINAVFIVLMAIAGLTLLATQVMIVLEMVDPVPFIEDGWLVALGALLTIVGIGAAYWIRYRCLKDFWSGNVAIQADHRIIRDGPYRVVRHPLYALALVQLGAKYTPC
jgi:protein-S-isoprenylcysteine O-methyltransferase Ste14